MRTARSIGLMTAAVTMQDGSGPMTVADMVQDGKAQKAVEVENIIGTMMTGPPTTTTTGAAIPGTNQVTPGTNRLVLLISLIGRTSRSR